jgi:23S rRNA (guanosine2251-2'-O)-methyltransferase
MSNFKKYTEAKQGNARRERAGKPSFRKVAKQPFYPFKPKLAFTGNRARRPFAENGAKEERQDTFIFGKNVIFEALMHKPETIEKIMVAKDKFSDERILDILNNQKTSRNNNNLIPVEYVEEESFPRVIKTQNHQGVFAKINLKRITLDYKVFMKNLEVTNKTCLLVLGELEDVQNVGSIIRSASAFDIAGILIPEHNQVQINETIIKISSGQAFNIPLVSIGNINNALNDLKEKKFWIYGLDMHGEKYVHDEKFTEPTVFVVGNEGEGLRKSFKENCDFVLKIPMAEKCESLNVSISTAVAMYEWKKQNLN